MNTKYDIDDVIYVPAKVEKITKTCDGKVFYRLRTDVGNYLIDTTEEQIDKEFVVIPDEHWAMKNGILAFKKAGDSHYQIALKDGCIFMSELKSGMKKEEN